MTCQKGIELILDLSRGWGENKWEVVLLIPWGRKGAKLQVLGRVGAQVCLSPSAEAGPRGNRAPERLWGFDLGSPDKVNPTRQRRVELLKGTSLQSSHHSRQTSLLRGGAMSDSEVPLSPTVAGPAALGTQVGIARS